MLTPTHTLKEQLDAAITRHGLAEVLDRLAELTHASDYANGGQIVKLLEDACHLSLVESDINTAEPPAERQSKLAIAS